MINTQKILKNSRLCSALTGMTPLEIEQLAPLFENNLIASRYTSKPNRKRKPGAGQKGKLPGAAEKLVLVLMYLKIYPTYDVLGFMVDLARSKAFRWVHLLWPVLETTLGRTLSLPERKLHSIAEVFAAFPEIKEVLIDGTERRIEKPKKMKRRNKLYSGKKKATTRKTVFLTTKRKRILAMTPTKSGRRHDKRIWDKFYNTADIPPDIEVGVDTGFQGLQHLHDKTIIPLKATKNKPLTIEQKQNNTLISSVRVVVEHAIGGVKRFKAASDVYRNKLPNLDDTFTYLSAGLWNFHLQFTS